MIRLKEFSHHGLVSNPGMNPQSLEQKLPFALCVRDCTSGLLPDKTIQSVIWNFLRPPARFIYFFLASFLPQGSIIPSSVLLECWHNSDLAFFRQISWLAASSCATAEIMILEKLIWKLNTVLYILIRPSSVWFLPLISTRNITSQPTDIFHFNSYAW